jgi:hypothetical protein
MIVSKIRLFFYEHYLAAVFMLMLCLIITAISAIVCVFAFQAQWECRAWHQTTMQSTIVIANECYVHDPRDSGRLVLFSDYVKVRHEHTR